MEHLRGMLHLPRLSAHNYVCDSLTEIRGQLLPAFDYRVRPSYQPKQSGMGTKTCEVPLSACSRAPKVVHFQRRNVQQNIRSVGFSRTGALILVETGASSIRPRLYSLSATNPGPGWFWGTMDSFPTLR
jgi:hypothetical protein